MKTISVITLVFALSPTAWSAVGSSCTDLKALALPDTQIVEATEIAQGTFPAPSGQHGEAPKTKLFAELRAFCRVQATVRPTADSDIKVEVWLPAEGWNGRLEAVGNGAFQSEMIGGYNTLAEALSAGYVVVGSNTGHEGKSGTALIGHPEKLVDWGNRAVHEMTVTAKSIVAARYGSPVKYSYWNSCSTGGRQGLVAAQYFPQDFDGLAVGDAANPMTRLQASTLYDSLTMSRTPESMMSSAKWRAYKEAVVKSCDAADGVVDGLLNDPMSCHFKPKDMLCKHGDNDACLTAPQVAALDKVLAGMKNPRTGEQLYPGWPVGANPVSFVVGPTPEDVAVDIFRALFQDPNWDYHTMDFDKDVAKADQLANSVMNAADPSKLKSLFDRGGKIFLYHGWSDPSITALQAIHYYNQVVAANGGIGKTYDSIRLFMAPGMSHCQGGDGPNSFDRMDVITKWVEEGRAPDRIVASHSSKDVVDRTRPLCPFPQVAKYKGTGSTDDAANFSCGNS